MVILILPTFAVKTVVTRVAIVALIASLKHYIDMTIGVPRRTLFINVFSYKNTSTYGLRVVISPRTNAIRMIFIRTAVHAARLVAAESRVIVVTRSPAHCIGSILRLRLT